MKVSIASTWRKLITIAARPAPLAYKPKVAARGERVSKGEGVGRAANTPGVFFVSICIGLLAICGVVIALLFLQVKEMKVEMVHWKQRLAAAEVHLGKIEKIAQQQIASPRHMPITLGNDDMKAIRAFIKVLPSKPGAQQKIHVGEEIWGIRSVPVPESLVNQIPKLRGARFLVDDNGAIIIIGQGSNRADAVIEPQ
jgi:hypothetical protein